MSLIKVNCPDPDRSQQALGLQVGNDLKTSLERCGDTPAEEKIQKTS